jgi:outer membrane protein TolC
MKKIAASLIFTAVVSAAIAQTNLPAMRELSLPDCIAAALQHNFDVRIERYEPQKSQYGLSAAYAGYDPLLSLSGSHSHSRFSGSITNGYSNNNYFQGGLGGSLPYLGTTYGLFANVADTTTSQSSGGQVGVDLRQPLLKNFWIDGTRLSIQTAKNQLKLSEQGLRLQIITTVTAVERAYYELIYARENVKVQQQALELAQKQLADDKTRVEVGTLAEAGGALEQDEAQVAQSRASLIAARYSLAASENALKTLITDSYADWHDSDIDPTEPLQAREQAFDIQTSWSKGMTCRPDLLQARVSLEQQGIQLRYDRNQLFPQLDLVGSFGYNGSGREVSDAFHQYGEADRPFYSYGAELSIPLSNARARNSYKASKAEEKQLLLRLKQLEQSAMVEIDNAVKQAQAAWESVDATQKSRIYAEAALKAEQGKYAAGKSTTFTVLQLQNSLTAARSQEIRALASYNQALASLAAAEGTTLQRRNIDFQVK